MDGERSSELSTAARLWEYQLYCWGLSVHCHYDRAHRTGLRYYEFRLGALRRRLPIEANDFARVVGNLLDAFEEEWRRRVGREVIGFGDQCTTRVQVSVRSGIPDALQVLGLTLHHADRVWLERESQRRADHWTKGIWAVYVREVLKRSPEEREAEEALALLAGVEPMDRAIRCWTG